MPKKTDHRIANGKAGLQRRKARSDGWTVAKRRIFLDEFVATGNARRACAVAGMAEGAAYRLGRRDPVFAAQYDAALATAKVRLESLLVEYAETRGRDIAIGDSPPADMANFDPELALKILNRRRPSADGKARRCGAKPQRASKTELTQAILKLLGVLARRRARLAQRTPGQ